MKRLVLLTAIAATMLLGTQSCYVAFNDGFCMSGHGDIISEEIILDDFTGIVNSTTVDVVIEQGDEQSVIIEGHQNMINELQLSVLSDELHIAFRNNCYNNFRLKVYITLPVLEEVEMKSTGDAFIEAFEDLNFLKLTTTSTGDIICEGAFEVANKLELKSTSTGDIEIEVYTEEIEARISGTGDFKIYGSCIYQDVDMSSTGNYNAYDLESEVCDVKVSGTGDAKLNVSDELTARLTSTGNVYYMGSPKVSVTDTSVGDLIHVN